MQKIQSELLRYANLRVYKNLSTLNLLNAMMCNRIMKKPILVKNSKRIYDLSSKIFGHTFVDVIINATFCKLLSSGTSISEADQTSENLRKQNIPVILGYCA